MTHGVLDISGDPSSAAEIVAELTDYQAILAEGAKAPRFVTPRRVGVAAQGDSTRDRLVVASRNALEANP